MKNYKRLLQLLLPYKKALVVGSIFLIAASATNLAVPLFIRNLVDVVMVQKNLDHLNDIAISIGFLFLIQLIFQTAHNYLFDVTEKRIMDAIHDFSGKKTIIMIAHRLTTLSNCDMILEYGLSISTVNKKVLGIKYC